MKKFLSLLMAALMILSLVPAAMADGPIELTFWHSWGSGKNYEAITELVTQFNAANEGKIVVTEQYIGGYADTLSKYMVAYSANENPHVCVIDACMTLNAVQYGIMENLTAYAAKNDPEYDETQFMDGMLVFSRDSEGVWSYPYARSTQIMYCNLNALEEITGSREMPKTWDDIWAFSEKWVAAKGTPAYSHPIGGGYYSYYITTIGFGEYYNEAGTGACMNLNNGWETALNAFRKAIDNGWYAVPSLSTAGYFEDFMAGNLPIMYTSTGSLTNVLTRERNFDVGVAYLPGGLREDGSIYNCVYTGGANLMMANNKSDAEKAAAWEFIKFMTSYDTNIYHSFKTGYVLTHVGAENSEIVQAKWAETPEFKTAYDQLQYVHETYVSIYTSEIDLEVVDALNAFAMDNVPVDEMMKNLENIMTSIFPDGVVETYN